MLSVTFSVTAKMTPSSIKWIVLLFVLTSEWIGAFSYQACQPCYSGIKNRKRMDVGGAGYKFGRMIRRQPTSIYSIMSFTEALSPQLNPLLLSNSFYIAESADFAEQIIEKVGPEVYRPIFLSGILLGFTGVIAAALAAVLVSQFNLGEELNRQFDEGKEAQLVQNVNEDENALSSIKSTIFEVDRDVDNQKIKEQNNVENTDDVITGLDL